MAPLQAPPSDEWDDSNKKLILDHLKRLFRSMKEMTGYIECSVEELKYNNPELLNDSEIKEVLIKITKVILINQDNFSFFIDKQIDIDDLENTKPNPMDVRNEFKKLSPTLGNILEEAGFLSEEQVDEIMKEKMESEEGKTLKETLIEKGLVREEDILDAVAQEMGLEKIDLSTIKITQELLGIIPEKMIKSYQIFPVKEVNDTIYIATSDPLNIQITDEIEKKLYKRVVGMVASESEIQKMIDEYFL